MPRRTDIRSILIIGSGPIVIGQGCEFDYSGVQACRALREEGYRVVLVNSNPATIMTDPEFADATYIEPITPETVEKILQREKDNGTPVDALLPTLGGQTGLNTGVACFDRGILDKFGVTMIGANREAIFKGEDRQAFKDLMLKIGLNVPKSGVVHTIEEARKVLDTIGLPAIIRPAFTLGGSGGGIAYNREEFESITARGLDASPVNEVLIEQSVIGWKEFEMEVIRDRKDNCIIVCSIENLDAMGVHTGDSITCAPIQTLTDKEYQKMRDASFAVIRAVGVETGGSNIQFGIDPKTGDMVVIEMNPRVSRSSALASKATGYPIAKIAAKLAVGYTLDELPNPITTDKSRGLHTSACFEPTIDYCVVKLPRFTFEKFPDADTTLTTQMKSVGEAMSIGRTFKEALQKGIRSLEVKRFGLGLDAQDKVQTWMDSRSAGDTVLPPLGGDEHWSKAGAIMEQAGTNTNEALADHGGTGLGPVSSSVLKQRRRNLPHSDPDGATYFLTFRVKHGQLTEAERKIVFDACTHWHGRKIDLHAAVVMPDHVHLLVTPRKLGDGNYYSLSELLKSVQGFSGLSIAKLRGVSGAVWLDESFDRIVRDQAEFDEKYNYILNNPVKQGLVSRPQDYEFIFDEANHRSDRSETGVPNPMVAMTRQGGKGLRPAILEEISKKLSVPNSERLHYVRYAMKVGMSDEKIYELSKIDPWFLGQMRELVEAESNPRLSIHQAKQLGYSDVQLATLHKTDPLQIRNSREKQGIRPVYKLVDTCAAEFEAATPYYYSTYEAPFVNRSAGNALPATAEDEIRLTDRPKVIIIGGGPNRIGQGIEFDYCCVQAAFAMREIGYESVMINSNPETVSTDYDTSDLLFFEPLTHEDVLNICERLNGRPFRPSAEEPQSSANNLVKGVIVQLGGQTPLNLARGLSEAGVPIIGTHIDSLDRAGDRELFRELLQKLGLKQPPNGIARDTDAARQIANQIGYPVLVRPSFVLGGRAMEIVYDDAQLDTYMRDAIDASTLANKPILIDKFLDNADECDLDCVADFDENGNGTAIVIGVMEHIEEAGIHSGDSACVLPPYTFRKDLVERLKDQARKLAKELRVKGLMNVQFAVKDDEIYVIEVNPRASRTVPFVGKATGIPWAKIAAKVMAGKTLKELGFTQDPPVPRHVSVKEVVFPFSKFPGIDIVLGPEMKSTGEVMGIDTTFARAFYKSQLAAGTLLPTNGTVYVSVRDQDKKAVVPIVKDLIDLGFTVIATDGTKKELETHGITVARVPKLAEGRPNIIDRMKSGQVQLIINTPTRKGPNTDEGKIRAASVMSKVPTLTTLTAASAAVAAIRQQQQSDWTVTPLQVWNKP